MMDKFDAKILSELSKMNKFDDKFVGVLEKQEDTTAIVRVGNPIHMLTIERKFNVINRYPFIRSVGITCNLKDAIALERMQEVEYVSAQGKVTACEDPPEITSDSGKGKCGANSKEAESDVKAPNTDGGEDINGTITRNGRTYANGRRSESETPFDVFALSEDLDGSGVALCVMDTGISPHSDISLPKERIIHFEDMVNFDSEPYDDNGHGTFISGVACGNGLLSGKRIRGVAPNANLVGVKVISQSGESGTFKILDGMQWLFDNFRRYGIRVVCMSFGADPLPYADPLKLGAEMLSRSGLIVVAAAGNSGAEGLKSPGISPEIITVGAVDENSEKAEFSSYGTFQGVNKPDVYAEGVKVRGIAAGSTYSYMTGTSAAAPYVAGACCLLCQKYRNITPWQAKNVILNCANTVNGNKILRL